MSQRPVNHTAIKALLDEPLMIGKHRPLIGKWAQKWVDEFVSSERIGEEESEEEIAATIKKLLLEEVEKSMEITSEKVVLADGWRRGMPIPQDAKWGKLVTVRYCGLRTAPEGPQVNG